MTTTSATTLATTLAILGGSGDLGSGLAWRWARAGHRILIGSRTAERAAEAAARLRERCPGADVQALDNEAAARAADIAVLTVPAAHQLDTLAAVRSALQGKILIDVTVPLVPPKVGTVQLPAEGSAGQRAQRLLGEGVDVVSAFQNISAQLLQQDVVIQCDVLVSGNKKAARERVIALAADAGMRGWHAGPIENAAAAEALTSILIQINRSGGLSHAGIRIVGDAAH